MNLTDSQLTTATTLQEVTGVPDGEAWGPVMDFTRACSAALHGVKNLAPPPEMQARMNAMWTAYKGLWAAEHERILKDAILDPELRNKIKRHPKGQEMIGHIFGQVVEQTGGVKTGVEVSPVPDEFIDYLFDQYGSGDLDQYD